MNEVWAAAGRPIFYTRFGLHGGEAVVGYVGSSDRMDFTVIGNTINLGSRLEGLNKIYGSQILVSAMVADAIKDKMVVRHVDLALPKGALVPVELYELIGARPDWPDAPADLVVDQRMIEMCARWEDPYRLYRGRAWDDLAIALDAFTAEFGDGTLTKLYFERVVQFTMEPPPDDWDGVIHYSEK